MQLQPGDALVVVDVQNDFVTGSLAVPGATEIVPLVEQAVRRFKSQNMPVFFTADFHPANHCSFIEQGGIFPPHCVRGTEGAWLVDDVLKPFGEDNKGFYTLFHKGTHPAEEAFSGFEGTELHQTLQARGISRLFICGIATDYCVKATVLDALKHGYTTVLLADAIAAVTPEGNTTAKEEMYKAGALARDVKWVKD